MARASASPLPTSGGEFYAPGEVSPLNSCYGCDPSVKTFGFVALTGTPCGTNQVCVSGTCKNGCVIDGTYETPNTTSPTDSCQRCLPAVSISAWSTASDGTYCSSTSVCIGGTCTPGCVIGGTAYPAGTPMPGDLCKGCYPSVSTTAWSSFPEGWSCGSGQICAGGACQSGCLINGTFYSPGPNPAGSTSQDGTPYCQACDPFQSTSYWSPAHGGSSCYAPHVDLARCSGTKCCGVSGTACQDLWDEFCCSGVCKFNGAWYTCQ